MSDFRIPAKYLDTSHPPTNPIVVPPALYDEAVKRGLIDDSSTYYVRGHLKVGDS